MEAEVFTRFLENPTIDTSGKDQTVFPSDYVPSDVQGKKTYDNCMHTDFINTIHPISYKNDGSNIIFDVYQTFKWVDILLVDVYFNYPKTTDYVYTKIE